MQCIYCFSYYVGKHERPSPKNQFRTRHKCHACKKTFTTSQDGSIYKRQSPSKTKYPTPFRNRIHHLHAIKGYTPEKISLILNGEKRPTPNDSTPPITPDIIRLLIKKTNPLSNQDSPPRYYLRNAYTYERDTILKTNTPSDIPTPPDSADYPLTHIYTDPTPHYLDQRLRKLPPNIPPHILLESATYLPEDPDLLPLLDTIPEPLVPYIYDLHFNITDYGYAAHWIAFHLGIPYKDTLSLLSQERKRRQIEEGNLLPPLPIVDISGSQYNFPNVE